MAMNKRKTTTAIVAGVTAAALLLGGTFAWTSISQQARNEAIVDINPGGRLHDDFNGTNKDVYVENFSSGATGVNIFARIRLDQYFEVGQDAGINKGETVRKVNQILGTNINDVTTWVTYTPGDLSDTSKVQANDNWQWNLGRDTEDGELPYYMPTFNKNKDSLLADINGTYEGTTEGDIVHYDDYKTYTENETATGTEIYDWDEDTNEEDEDAEYDNGGITYNENTPIDSADVYHKTTDENGDPITHTAAQINYGSTVITMAQWEAEGSQPGNYWVYDTDGWAYWANYIAPGETTGLLLDSINMSRVPDDNYYYGINVVGQFATASDWTMLYESTDNGGGGSMTEEAKSLMELITGATSTEDGGNENPPAETPTYYTMDVDYPIVSGTTVNLGVQDYTAESTDGIQYYIINKANNPSGGSDTELAANGDLKVVPITFVSGGGNQTLYYYAELFTSGSAVTTSEDVEGVTFAALDGDTVVAFSCTKVYDSTVHTYLGRGNHSYVLEGVTQNAGCLVFESKATPGTYCTVGDANIGVDGDDVFKVSTVDTANTETDEDGNTVYTVTDITETDCTCTVSAEDPTT